MLIVHMRGLGWSLWSMVSNVDSAHEGLGMGFMGNG